MLAAESERMRADILLYILVPPCIQQIKSPSCIHPSSGSSADTASKRNSDSYAPL